MIVTSESVVLRVRKQGETSKIATLYTRNYGKLNVIAKGAREIKSKFGGSLEMFNVVSAVFYKKEKEDALYLLSKSDVVGSNSRVSSSLKKMESAMAAVELVIRAMHDEEENQKIFESLRDTLHAIGAIASDASASVFLLRFYLEFASASGFAIKLQDDDPIPDEDLLVQRKTSFLLDSGELIDYLVEREDDRNLTTQLGMPVSDEARKILRSLDNATDWELANMVVTESVRTELIDLFHAYFANHLQGFSSRTLKSGRVFSGL